MLAAVVADDFTGANDCAASFARRGFSAYAALGPFAPPQKPDVYVTSIESRFGPADEARRLSRRAWTALARRCQGRQWSYQRMDSTLRGHAGPEMLGMLEALGPKRLAFCAAYPSQGRVIRGGTVYVRGQRLDQSEYARDPLTPSRTAQPLKLFPDGLAAQLGEGSLAQLRRRIADSSARILCFDASTDRDLEIIARACLAEGIRHFAGASGLSAALAGLWGTSKPMPPRKLPAKRAILAGSVSQTCLDQLAHLGASGLAPWFDLESGPPSGQMPRFALSSLRRRSQMKGAGQASAEARLRRLAGLGLRLGGSPWGRLWMLTGGHTATVFYRALNLSGNWVRGEIAPGLALLEAHLKGKRIFTCTKPGGFGAVDVMERFMRAKEAR